MTAICPVLSHPVNDRSAARSAEVIVLISCLSKFAHPGDRHHSSI